MTEAADETMPGDAPETPGTPDAAEPAAEPAAEAAPGPDAEGAPLPGVAPQAPEETPAGDVAPGPTDAPEGAARTVPDEDGLAEALPLVEALLFAASKPVPLDKLAEAAELPEDVVERAVSTLEASCGVAGRGVRLDRVAGGVRLVSRPEYDYPVRRLLGLDGRTKLSMAALETLAIIAYRQPVTGPEVAELRGVNSSSSIRTLLDRKLITTAGRKEVVGTPFLYKTTKEFLVHFGLKGLADLPKPEELEAIYGLEAPRPDPDQTELFHVDEATGELEVPEGEPAAPPATAGGTAAQEAAPGEGASTAADEPPPAAASGPDAAAVDAPEEPGAPMRPEPEAPGEGS